MFVAFANIEEPNALTEIEARQLHTELLMGTPSVTHRQVAKNSQVEQKIQRAWEQTGEVDLNDDEKRVVLVQPSTVGAGEEA